MDRSYLSPKAQAIEARREAASARARARPRSALGKFQSAAEAAAQAAASWLQSFIPQPTKTTWWVNGKVRYHGAGGRFRYQTLTVIVEGDSTWTVADVTADATMQLYEILQENPDYYGTLIGTTIYRKEP